MNKIWDGPRKPDGTKLWVGWERGALPGVTAPSQFGEQINRYWMHRDPFFNWRTISEEEFMGEQLALTQQFSQYISSDSTNHAGAAAVNRIRKDEVAIELLRLLGNGPLPGNQ